jgi:hypothetical protein
MSKQPRVGRVVDVFRKQKRNTVESNMRYVVVGAHVPVRLQGGRFS